MPDFGRNSRNDDPSLDAIVRSDQFIDALANGYQPAAQDRADAMLASLLGEWRDETRWPPATGLITERDAVTALNAGIVEKRNQRGSGPGRSWRGLSIVGAAAAGVLAIGGFGAVVYGAGPGDALYGLHTMLFGEPKNVREDQVALASAAEQLKQVQQLVEQGDWPAAQAKLVEVNNQVAGVADAPQKQQVLEQWNELAAKVVQKDPAATVPPGITFTVPPSATELVPAVVTPSEGPGVPPTSVPGLPPITISTTPGEPSAVGGPGPSETSSSTETTSPAPQSTSTTVAPTTTSTTTAPTTTAVPTTTAPSTSSSAPTTSASSTTSSSPTTSATTSAPATSAGTTPTSTTATTTTKAAPTTTTTTTTGAAAAAQSPALTAATTTSVLVEQSATTAASTVSAPPAASTPSAIATVPSTAVQAPKSQPQIVITTTVVPLPLPAG